MGASVAPAQSTDAGAQEKEPCNLTLAQLPLINGLRLGMTPDEVLALFPGSREDAALRTEMSKPATEFGVNNFVIVPGKYRSADKFPGVNRIAVTLLDGRVSNFSITFNGPQYPHVDNFVADFVRGKSLPAADAWQPYAGMEEQLKVLTCSGFEIRAFATQQSGVQSYILVKDLDAEQRLKERKAKKRAAAAAKP